MLLNCIYTRLMPTYKRNVLIRSWRRRAPTAPSAKLDGKYKRLRRVVVKLAHKAQWHNEGNAPIYARVECCPLRSSCVGSLK